MQSMCIGCMQMPWHKGQTSLDFEFVEVWKPQISLYFLQEGVECNLA